MKIVAVVGDYYHDKAVFSKALNEATKNIEGLELIYSDRLHLLDKLKEMPELVILASGNRLDPEGDVSEKWLTDSAEQQITDYVKEGGKWFAWHSGLAGYEKNRAYVKMLGGYFIHHPDEQVSVQYRYRGNHGFRQGRDYFVIKDEHYFIKRIEPSAYFLESVSTHGISDAGWTKQYGDGKVCCYIPAHNEEGLMGESVQRDLSDIILWFSE